ncbi:MAG: sulfatase-like hydrolase/transferase [Ignavibacteriae bacterium]|nr:sulfatase-like hydrolase/transferase [Ignavibacteria bacterium]MBI3364611.1 sulfatase-like hydrolase/transferase [Ignavibacteriota bacterium]
MMVSQEFKEKLFSTLVVSLFLSSTISIFAPAEIYYTNTLEFAFPFSRIVLICLLLAVCLTIIVTGLLLLPKGVWHRRMVTVVFMVGILLWLQGNILRWDYGLLNGRDIDWSAHWLHGIIDAALWILGLVLSWFFSEKLYKVVRTGGAAFLGIQLFSLLLAIWQAPPTQHFKLYDSDATNKYTFSSHKNVIILVLDTFESEMFQKIISEDPSYKDAFDGFTYFRNALGGYPSTYLAVPFILTGQYYYNDKPIEDFLKSAYNSETSILKVLKQNNFNSEYYFYGTTAYLDDQIMSNVQAQEGISVDELGRLYDVALFRYLPQYVKKSIYDEQRWFLQEFIPDTLFIGSPEAPFYGVNKSPRAHVPDESIQQFEDVEFIHSMMTHDTVGTATSVFKYFHLHGAHPPFRMNENLQNENNMANGYERQGKGALKIAKLFLDELKSLQIFDSSLIVILGDHGLTENLRNSAVPLMLVKRFNAHGTLSVSEAPVSQQDIGPTIFSELGIRSASREHSMFSINDTTPRERTFMYYMWGVDGSGWSQDHVPDIREYVVNGHSWEDTSWKPTYRVFTSAGVKSNAPSKYRLGDTIRFVIGGNALPYQLGGWAHPESSLTWTAGTRASLNIPIDTSLPSVLLTASLHPFVEGKTMLGQHVDLSVQGILLGSWEVRRDGEYRIMIPDDMVQGDILRIDFHLPDAAARSALGLSNDDPRDLGIGVGWIRMNPLARYVYGSPIGFKVGGNALPYLGRGWSVPEGFGTWTEGPVARVNLVIPPSNGDLLLEAKFKPFVFGRAKQQFVILKTNDHEIGKWEASDSGAYHARIPKSTLHGDLLRISFEMPDAKSPRELGMNDDPRILGVAVNEMDVKEIIPYPYGTRISFLKGGDAGRYTVAGWSEPEPAFTWTEGRRAELKIPVSPPSGDVTLSASVFPFLAPRKVRSQKVVIRADGKEIGKWSVAREGTYTVRVPQRFLSDGLLNLEFQLPNAISPKAVSNSADTRVLAIAFRSLMIDTGRPPTTPPLSTH